MVLPNMAMEMVLYVDQISSEQSVGTLICFYFVTEYFAHEFGFLNVSQFFNIWSLVVITVLTSVLGTKAVALLM